MTQQAHTKASEPACMSRKTPLRGPDYILLRSITGIRAGLETASLGIEPLHDDSGNNYIAFADDYISLLRKPVLVEDANYSGATGIDKQYVWRFEEVVTGSVELEDFMGYCNVDRKLEADVDH